jgi:hypothetical protein
MKNPYTFMLTRLFVAILVVLLGNKAAGQAPKIAYGITQQTVAIGVPITSLKPTNTGGPVPPAVYGKVSVLAGSGNSTFANGTGTAASFPNPAGLVTDAVGNIYVLDVQETQQNVLTGVIRKITPAGVVTSFVTDSRLEYAAGITIDRAGNLYTTSGTEILKITTAGAISVLAGSDNLGSLNGQGATASFSDLEGMTIDSLGNLYAIDNTAIREITPGGSVSTLNIYGLYYPVGIAINSQGFLFVTDDSTMNVVIVKPGYVNQIIGTGQEGSSNGTGLQASFNNPSFLTFDAAGNVYVCDSGNSSIREIKFVSGVGYVVSTLAVLGTTNQNFPYGIAPDGTGNLYVSDVGAYVIDKIKLTGYTISPALPPGLTFDATTGTISGTPTASAPPTYYTITAYNTYGSSSYTLGLTVTPPIVFNPLPVQVYGAADFDPMATSLVGAVTYTSSNAKVATIVSGKVHLTGAGTTTITAIVGANAATQTLKVGPAALTVTANNLVTVQGVALPSLTVTYTGFVNGDSQSSLTTQPTVSTTATSSSAIGNYPITVSGGTAASYTITDVNGSLSMYPVSVLQSPATTTYGNADFYIFGKATSGVSYSSSNTGAATVSQAGG